LLRKQETLRILHRGLRRSCSIPRAKRGSWPTRLQMLLLQSLAPRASEKKTKKAPEDVVTKGVPQHPFHPVESTASRSAVSAVTKRLGCGTSAQGGLAADPVIPPLRTSPNAVIATETSTPRERSSPPQVVDCTGAPDVSKLVPKTPGLDAASNDADMFRYFFAYVCTNGLT